MPDNVLVMVVDGLRASALGAYGNTSFATPALDRFAAESLLFDWCYATSPELNDIYRSLWLSRQRPTDAATISVPRLFARSAYATTLVTDEPSLSSFAAAENFDEIVQVSNSSDGTAPSQRADDASQTDLARSFAAAIELLGEKKDERPRLVWFHTRGMYGQWDAPLELQDLLLDEDDPRPIETVAAPDVVMDKADDPETAFSFACAYAAQVMVLDECVAGLRDVISNQAGGDWTVVLVGARGFPLGEHGRIGGVDPRMHAEQLHVPLLIHCPDKFGHLTRVSALTSHADLLPTLADRFDRGRPVEQAAFDGKSVLPLATSSRTPWREALLSTSTVARSIRNAAWCLREDRANQSGSAGSHEVASASELYVRPDDRWEANDVAKLCPDVVDELRAKFGDC